MKNMIFEFGRKCGMLVLAVAVGGAATSSYFLIHQPKEPKGLENMSLKDVLK